MGLTRLLCQGLGEISAEPRVESKPNIFDELASRVKKSTAIYVSLEYTWLNLA